MKVILIHGNGGSTPHDNWFPWVKDQLEAKGIRVLSPQFPDAPLARESFWMPFLKEIIDGDEDVVIIGHSTGAIVAMRFAETHKLLGTVLVGSYHSDLGIENEKLSGYFDRPWDWDAIQSNQQWIIQFASTDDPWIPIEEARTVHKRLNTEYYEFESLGHFGGDYYKETFPQLVAAVCQKIIGQRTEFERQ